MDRIDENINPSSVIPLDGIVIAECETAAEDGATAFDALIAAAREQRVAVDYVVTRELPSSLRLRSLSYSPRAPASSTPRGCEYPAALFDTCGVSVGDHEEVSTVLPEKTEELPSEQTMTEICESAEIFSSKTAELSGFTITLIISLCLALTGVVLAVVCVFKRKSLAIRAAYAAVADIVSGSGKSYYRLSGALTVFNTHGGAYGTELCAAHRSAKSSCGAVGLRRVFQGAYIRGGI